MDLLLDDRAECGLIQSFGAVGLSDRIRDKPDPALFRLPPPRRIDAGPRRDPCGNPVQPACDRIELADRSSLLDQHQKRGLKRVFRVLEMAQDVAADPQHHGPMPRDQGLEGRFGGGVWRTGHALDQVSIRKPCQAAGFKQGVEVSLEDARRSAGHESALSPNLDQFPRVLQ